MNCGNCKKFIIEGALIVTVMVVGMEIKLCSEICHKELEKNVHSLENNNSPNSFRNIAIYGASASVYSITDSGNDTNYRRT